MADQLNVTILGVLSDTHVPDRVRELRPEVLSFFEQAEVDAILHAGDISVPSVLEQLQTLAPVYAVRGNRDWFKLRNLPGERWLEFEGVKIVLVHGQGSLMRYLVEKVLWLTSEFEQKRYQKYLLAKYPAARVIVFGHTHHTMNAWMEGKLLFNPGSPHELDPGKFIPSLGLLRIQAGGQVEGEIIELG